MEDNNTRERWRTLGKVFVFQWIREVSEDGDDDEGDVLFELFPFFLLSLQLNYHLFTLSCFTFSIFTPSLISPLHLPLPSLLFLCLIFPRSCSVNIFPSF